MSGKTPKSCFKKLSKLIQISDTSAKVVIIEDNDDGENEYTETKSSTSYNESANHLPSLSAGATLPTAWNQSTTMPNGEHRSYVSTDSSCVITVFCDTSEVYI